MTDPVATTLIITIGSVVTALVGLVFKRLGDVGDKVDGRFTKQEEEFRKRFDEQEQTIALYRAEVVRLQQYGATTPFGKPSEAHPVTLTAGDPMTLPPTAPAVEQEP